MHEAPAHLAFTLREMPAGKAADMLRHVASMLDPKPLVDLREIAKGSASTAYVSERASVREVRTALERAIADGKYVVLVDPKRMLQLLNEAMS